MCFFRLILFSHVKLKLPYRGISIQYINWSLIQVECLFREQFESNKCLFLVLISSLQHCHTRTGSDRSRLLLFLSSSLSLFLSWCMGSKRHQAHTRVLAPIIEHTSRVQTNGETNPGKGRGQA